MMTNNFNKQRSLLVVLTAIAVMLLYFFLNFNFLSNWIDERRDSLTYYNLIQKGEARGIFNPHHIGFDWLGAQLYKAALANGYEGDLMRILQLRNLFIASFCLGTGFYLFFRFSGKFFLALIVTGLMAFNCAVWIYSQINDTAIIHSMLVFLLFFFACYFPQSKNPIASAVFLGVFHSIVIFFHQSDGVFFLTITFIILFGDRFLPSKKNSPCRNAINTSPKKYSQNIGYFLIYLLVFILILVIAYYFVAIVLLDLTFDPNSSGYFNSVKGSDYFFYWLVLYSNFKSWGKGYEEEGLFQKALRGIESYFYQPGQIDGKTIKADFSSTAPEHLLPNMLIILVVLVLTTSLLLFRPLMQYYGFIYLASILFLLSYIIFALWWEPDYREFWVAPMNAFWILAFLVINFIINKLSVIKPIPQSLIYSFLVALIIMLFVTNLKNLIYPTASYSYRVFDYPGKQIILDK